MAQFITPPVFFKGVAALRRSVRRSPGGGFRIDFRPEWEHLPEGWRHHDPRAIGWRHASIAETQCRGPLAFNFFAKDEIVPTDESAHNGLMTFAYVLARAVHGNRQLSVLDWGGGPGHYALVAEALLPEVTFDYVVKELPALCELGMELMPSVQFQSDEAICFSRRYDVVLAINSIQYAENWPGLLTRLAAAANEWLFIGRVPIAQRAKSFVVVQRPHEYGYQTEYISWVINRDELLSRAASLDLTLDREFLSGGVARFRSAPDVVETFGFLFRPSRGAPSST